MNKILNGTSIDIVWQLKSLICGTEERQALKETE
jgi:hypothetical protein